MTEATLKEAVELAKYVLNSNQCGEITKNLASALLKYARPWSVEAGRGAEEPISFLYRNWRGEVSKRRVVPLRLWYGSTEWHPELQWLLVARCLDRGEERFFALSDITNEEDHTKADAYRSGEKMFGIAQEEDAPVFAVFETRREACENAETWQFVKSVKVCEFVES